MNFLWIQCNKSYFRMPRPKRSRPSLPSGNFIFGVIKIFFITLNSILTLFYGFLLALYFIRIHCNKTYYRTSILCNPFLFDCKFEFLFYLIVFSFVFSSTRNNYSFNIFLYMYLILWIRIFNNNIIITYFWILEFNPWVERYIF